MQPLTKEALPTGLTVITAFTWEEEVDQVFKRSGTFYFS